jgi:hypothetical protein
MDYRTAHIRQIRATQRFKMRLAGAALLGVVICMSGVLIGQRGVLQPSLVAAAVDAAPADTAGGFVTAAANGGQAQASQGKARRVYPYSIVPGGVTDRAELARVLKTDKVAAAHYAGFQVDRVKPVTVAKARAVYVSYRKGDQVYWTSRKVMLAEGETLLSDGNSEIRTRCGNRISDTARLPVGANEPSPEVLDTAMDVDGDADAGSAQPVSMAIANDGPGAIGPTRTPVTFATGPALIQSSDPGTAYPMPQADTPAGLARTYNGRLGTVASPQVSQHRPAASAGPGSRGANGSIAVSGKGNGGAGTRTLAIGADPTGPLGSGTPVLASNDDPATPISPELPPLPDTLAPVPAVPVAPATPNANASDVPEPGSLWLSGLALAALAVLRRRQRQPR